MSRAMAAARLEAFASGVRRLGIDVKVDLREGEACHAVLQSAIEDGCDLLVIGTHGIYRGVHHLVIGSNAEKILLFARCPVLTVGRHVMAGIDLDLRIDEMLVITDSRCESLSPLLYRLWLGSEFGVTVDLMHVKRDDDSADSVFGRKARRSLQRSAQTHHSCRRSTMAYCKVSFRTNIQFSECDSASRKFVERSDCHGCSFHFPRGTTSSRKSRLRIGGPCCKSVAGSSL